MSTIVEIPLNSGMDQTADRVLQGQDKLTLVQNARLARDGRLEVRPSFTALSTATYSSQNMTAYDLASYAGRLVALGDQTSSGGQGHPTDLFEWIASQSKWRATSGADTNGITGQRLPVFTDIRAVGALPDIFGAVTRVACAAGGGYVCAAIGRDDGQTTIHVFDPATDQTLLAETVDMLLPAALFINGTFRILGVDSNDDIVQASFAPATDETLSYSVMLPSTVPLNDVAMGAFGTGYACAFCHTTLTTVITFNSSGAVQTSFTAFATGSESCAVVGNAAGTLLTVARQALVTDDVTFSTFNAAGALQTGPTAAFTGSGVRLGITIQGSTLFIIGADEINNSSQGARFQQSTHTQTGSDDYDDARLAVAPFLVGSTVYAGWFDLTATNFDKGTFHITAVVRQFPQCFLLAQLCETQTTNTNLVGTAGVDGTKVYIPVVSRREDNGTPGQKLRYTIFEAETSALNRRQTTQVGGELLVAGGLPLTYDGRTMVEQGFAERPVVASVAQGTTGALTLLGVYRAIVVWEVFDGKNRILRSQASDPREVTLTGANDDITWTLTTPHSLRRHPVFADQNLTVRARLYRTEAGEGVFFLDGETIINPTDNPAEFVTFLSTQSDSQLIDNAILYEQSQAAISNCAPGPYSYIWPMRERGLAGGQPEPEAWTASKLLFPGEPLEWAFSGRLGFSGRVNQPITAVASFETAGLVWTESDIWMIPGRGPEHNGTGEFDPSTPIATPGGTASWQSVIVAPPGAFFQMRPDQLMLLGRGGAVDWIGSPVQDTLALYPEISGCVFVRQQDIVAFACNNVLGTDGVFLVYDMRDAQWYVDTIGAAITAVTEFDGRLVYISGGTVFLQDLTVGLGVGALPAVRFETPSYRFFSALGYGDLIKVGLVGTYLGDCTISLSLSYDDGKTWTTPVPFAVTAAAMSSPTSGAALSAGDPINLIWTPAKMETDRFRIRVDMTNASASGGCRLHLLSLEVEGTEFTSRQPAQNQR